MHTETVDLGADAGFQAVFEHDIAVDRGRIDVAVKALEQFDEQPNATNDLLTRQVAYINSECTWRRRADEWEQRLRDGW